MTYQPVLINSFYTEYNVLSVDNYNIKDEIDLNFLNICR